MPFVTLCQLQITQSRHCVASPVCVCVFVWRATVQATQNHEMKACDAQFGG